ncbi:MAG: hypothetical protein J7L26_03435 [Candidatus Aminicenantes bacterium]|nr:hypothetical protein [Candidatus Aminicenantes bacterium]
MQSWQKFEPQIEGMAHSLSQGDYNLYQDLLQEMRIALWEAEMGHTGAWYLDQAKSAALKFLRRWRKRTNDGEIREIPVSMLEDSSQAQTNNLLCGIYEDNWD